MMVIFQLVLNKVEESLGLSLVISMTEVLKIIQ